jgi:hypothetical protein
VKPLRIVETSPGSYSLLLETHEAPVHDLIEELEHEPNGYFWQGIAELLITSEAPDLTGLMEFDSEGGMFCAYAEDRRVLEELGSRMAVVATDHSRMRQLVEQAHASGFEFDD